MKRIKRLTLKLVVLAATMNATSVLAQNAETTIEQMPAAPIAMFFAFRTRTTDLEEEI